MDYKKQVLGVYNRWYKNNRAAIEEDKWSLVDKDILSNPEKDRLRGLNLLSFLPISVRKNINKTFLPKLESVVSTAGWYIPDEARHITVLDIIPHNSGLSIKEIEEVEARYVQAIDQVFARFNTQVKIGLEGIFASPDGITIQGFPANEGLPALRQLLRDKLNKAGLLNLEDKKYFIETAHIALVKFIDKLDGHMLLRVVDELRNVPLGSFEINKIILNISPRYDKTKTIKAVKEYRLGN